MPDFKHVDIGDPIVSKVTAAVVAEADKQVIREAAKRHAHGSKEIRHPIKQITFGQSAPLSLEAPLIPVCRVLSRLGLGIEGGSAGQILPRNKSWQPYVIFTGEDRWATEIAKLNESYAYERSIVPQVIVAYYSVCLEIQWSRERGVPIYSLWWHDLLSMLDYTRWLQERFGRVDDEEIPQDPKPRPGIPGPMRGNITRTRKR